MAKRKKKTKEDVYDSEIFPLMEQVLEICKREKIVMVASYYLDDDLACSSYLNHKGHHEPDSFIAAYRALMNHSSSPLMITTRNGDGKVTNITAVMP